MRPPLFADRRRSNVLKQAERWMIQRLCRILPLWLTPNHLTAVGLAGSGIVFAGLWLGRGPTIWILLSGEYTIDSFHLGPTELRLLLAAVLVGELILPGTLLIFAGGGAIALAVVVGLDFRSLLRHADARDELERAQAPKARVL